VSADASTGAMLFSGVTIVNRRYHSLTLNGWTASMIKAYSREAMDGRLGVQASSDIVAILHLNLVRLIAAHGNYNSYDHT
jgi:hypothetical protein